MAKRVSIKDVAREAGLSETAVSLVLNDRPCRIAPQSKERIREAARRLNYRANEMAKGLALRRSNTMGLVVPDIENPFFSSLAKRLECLCSEAGMGLLITNSDDESERDCEQLRRLEARGVDGIVLVPSNEVFDELGTVDGGEGRAGDDRRKGLVSVLAELSVPYVMVDRAVDGVDCDKVYVDNEKGARLAVEHLVAQGHQRIGCLAKTRGSRNGRQRLVGYRRALEEAGLPFDVSLVGECDYHSVSGYRAVEALVGAGATAVFSTSDIVTLGAAKRLAELGVEVPRDLSLVSFDRNESSAFLLPGMTAVRQDVAELASRAFAFLQERICGYDGAGRASVVEPELVLGQSVRAL